MGAYEDGRTTGAGARAPFLDNLRTFMIFLVVLCHAAGVYESSGAWGGFWIVDDPAVNNLAGLLFLVCDIFMMPTIFLISGYLAPLSLDRRGGWAFVKARCRRLMAPWAMAVVTLVPLYKVIFLWSRGLPQEHWTTYFHWSNGIWSQNWLWFPPVLFAFNVLYAAVRAAPVRRPRVSVRGAVCVAFAAAFAYSLGMDLLGWRGWTKSVLLDFQNERVLIYLTAFWVGVVCYRRRVFAEKGKRGMLYHIVNATNWIPVTCYIVFLLYPWFKPGGAIVSPVMDRAVVWLSFHVSLICLVYVMVETFRRYMDRAGKVLSALRGCSYGVYIVHVIVIGMVATALLRTSMPSLVKFAVVAVSSYVLSVGVVLAYDKLAAGIGVRVRRCVAMQIDGLGETT